MKISFYKYHGTGNDFILIDNRRKILSVKNIYFFRKICDRRFGIGADGVILLQKKSGYDFEMKYYNADGRESTMCGNGGRCIVHFANYLGIIKSKTIFNAIDGEHYAEIDNRGVVTLKMQDVNNIKSPISHLPSSIYLIDTGSPHYVQFVKNVNQTDVVNEGKKIRYSKRFKQQGVNVNFVEIRNNNLFVRTYERGVEDETLSCGTGVVASAIAFALKENTDKQTVNVQTKGGNLKVKFHKSTGKQFSNVFLIGSATMVFRGEMEI